MTLLAKFIKQQREAKGISQGKLGKALGFANGQFISNIENGKDIQYPPKYFKKISRFLRIDIIDLNMRALQDYEHWLIKEINKGR